MSVVSNSATDLQTVGPIFPGLSQNIPIYRTVCPLNISTPFSTAYALGANSYIVKPVAFDNFMDVAQQIELYWCLTNEPPR